jgi:rhodanese-related sulfurtransferase
MTSTTISPDDFQKLLQSAPPPHLIDVRTPAEFDRVHAAGAVCIPLDRLSADALRRQIKSQEEPVYLLCKSGMRAAQAQKRLIEAGYTRAICVAGGTTAWEHAGLPVERGPTRVISLDRQVRIAAGTLVLLGVALGWLVHPVFLGLTAFVGAGLAFAGITDTCGMSLLLAKMPWNR